MGCEHKILNKYKHTTTNDDLFYKCLDCNGLIAFPTVIEGEQPTCVAQNPKPAEGDNP